MPSRAGPAQMKINHQDNFHLVLHAVYKNPPDATQEQLSHLEGLTLRRLDELNVDALITVMYAFARTSYHPSPVLISRMAAATEADMASFTPRQLEHAAWSLAHVRHRPSPTWLDNFACALEVNWDYFRPAQLAATLVDAAACGLATLPAATLADQLPASMRKAAAPDAATAPSTMARLVWSAGHFGSPPAPAPAPASSASSQRPGPQAAPISASGADAAPALGAAGGGRVRVQVREEELLSWWEDEAVLEAAAPEDLVLVLHGLASLGVRPTPAWTSRLLGRLLGRSRAEAVGALDARHLGLLGWAALKLVEGQLPREWLEAYMQALRARLRGVAAGAAAGQAGVGTAGAEAAGAVGGQGGEGLVAAAAAGVGSGSGLAGAEHGGAEPGDVALALSSLAGLGAHMAGGAEGAADVAAYWRGGGRWAALSAEEQTLLRILGYGPA
ncbi:hypothetical protein HXX76_010352 [Chlamydomonas incerta]|uniref:Uncharacterized protein n=1 Tax=Chlamydomonas incerta TaxID=51695 RepID=A0A835SNG3_CHLIN|nr:hypothetical protein HXX76_010352 [Chlamydomonas incerta]|eukprot:KAG2430254.1 hypothetical protein HXX76_010352 [Chlamydomonas incerta]